MFFSVKKYRLAQNIKLGRRVKNMEAKKKAPKVRRLKVPSPKIIKSKKTYDRRRQNSIAEDNQEVCK